MPKKNKKHPWSFLCVFFSFFFWIPGEVLNDSEVVATEWWFLLLRHGGMVFASLELWETFSSTWIIKLYIQSFGAKDSHLDLTIHSNIEIYCDVKSWQNRLSIPLTRCLYIRMFQQSWIKDIVSLGINFNPLKL